MATVYLKNENKNKIVYYHNSKYSIEEISERMSLPSYEIVKHLRSVGIHQFNTIRTTDNPINQLEFNKYYKTKDFDSKYWDCSYPFFKLYFNENYSEFIKIKNKLL